MQALALVGLLISAVGVAGYLVGIADPYPGRAFSLTLLMIGVTLVLVGRGERGVEA
jgi:hypothetical protein